MSPTPSPSASSPGNLFPTVPLAAGAAAPVAPSTASAAAPATAPPPFALPPRWPLEHGGTLAGGRLAYELTGPAGAPVVAVLGGISASRHVTATAEDPRPGWWQPLVGPGRAVDTERFRVLSCDFLGGNGDSSGPRAASHRNGSAAPFPAVSTADQARALALLLDALGVLRLEAFVGASYGGMVALAFAARYPFRLRQLVVISAAERSHPQATAWRSVQRQIVRLARRQGDAHAGLVLSRGLAMTTYRTPDELAQRFDAAPQRTAGGFRFPVEEYLEARGEAFARTFDADAFLCLSESIDLHRVDAARILAAATLVAVRSDQLVPLAQMRELRGRLGGPSRLVELDSLYGHDAFLKEVDAVAAVVGGCLAEDRLAEERPAAGRPAAGGRS